MLPTEAPQGRKGPQGSGIWEPTQGRELRLYGVLQPRKQIKEIINRQITASWCEVSAKNNNLHTHLIYLEAKLQSTSTISDLNPETFPFMRLSDGYIAIMILQTLSIHTVVTTKENLWYPRIFEGHVFGSELIFIKPQVFDFRPFN